MEFVNADLSVQGMTCSSCEIRISKALSSTRGINSVNVSLSKAAISLEYDSKEITLAEIKTIIERLGYSTKDKDLKSSLLPLLIGLSLVSAYSILNYFGLFNKIPSLDASLGYGMLLIAGFLTSFHCIAMCGGIALSAGLKGDLGSKKPNIFATLQYNLGRVVSYTIVGFIVGGLGQVFAFSSLTKSLIMAFAGICMILYAGSIFGVFNFKFDLFSFIPKGIKNSKFFLKIQDTAASSFIIGLLNGLMPCGPLQNMQLYALGTGSMLSGGLSMFVFSIGTIPLMVLFASSALFLPKKILPLIVKSSAVLILFLGIVTFARAGTLSGFSIPIVAQNDQVLISDSKLLDTQKQNVELSTKEKVGTLSIENGVQTIITEFKNGSYVPFTIKVGLPLKWIIRVGSRDLNGCNNPLTVPSLGIKKKLIPGDNLIEFTPQKSGVIVYTCWMGMVSSTITVQD